jgi:hypothetical protein
MSRREPKTVLDRTRTSAAGGGPRGIPRAAMAGAVAVTLALVLAGCSSSTSPSTPSAASSSSSASSAASSEASGSTSYPAGKEEICEARDQLKTSITALTKPALLLGGTDAIKAAVSQVQTDVSAMVTAGKQDYAPQVDALQASTESLQTAVGDLGSGSVTTNMQAVGTAIAATGTAASDLFTQLQAACGS